MWVIRGKDKHKQFTFMIEDFTNSSEINCFNVFRCCKRALCLVRCWLSHSMAFWMLAAWTKYGIVRSMAVASTHQSKWKKEAKLCNYSWLKQINTNYFHRNSFTLDLVTRATFWNTTSSLFFIWMCHSAFSQSNVQRLTSCTTLKTAQKSMIYLIVGVALIMLSTCGNGIIMYAYYYFCDPVKAGIVSKYDKLTSRFVQDVTGHIPGMSGIRNGFNLFPLSKYFHRNRATSFQAFSFRVYSALHWAPCPHRCTRYPASFTSITFDHGNGLQTPTEMQISRWEW